MQNPFLLCFAKKMATNDVVEKAFHDEEMTDTTAKQDEPSGESEEANVKIDEKIASSVDVPIDKYEYVPTRQTRRLVNELGIPTIGMDCKCKKRRTETATFSAL